MQEQKTKYYCDFKETDENILKKFFYMSLMQTLVNYVALGNEQESVHKNIKMRIIDAIDNLLKLNGKH